MNRRDTIVSLLEHYRDCFEISSVGSGTGVGPMLPAMAHHPSVRELVRCLERLYEQEPVTHAHVKGYYTAEWRLASARKRSQLAVAERERAVYDTRLRSFVFRQRLTPRWIDQEEVVRGVDWIDNDYRLEPVDLPRELWYGVLV